MKFPVLRPKLLGDVKPPQFRKGSDVFKPLPKRVNLGYRREKKISLAAFIKSLVVVVSVAFLIFGSVTAPTMSILAADTSSQNNGAERQALEDQLKALEGQIDEYENQIVTYQKQGRSLKGEIGSLDSKISRLSLQIKAIKLNIKQLDQKIDETEYQITTTRNNIDANRKSLASILKNLYQSEQTSLMEVFLNSPKISDFFNDLNDLTLLQNSLQESIHKIADLQTQLQDQRDQLGLAKADQSELKQYQEDQKQVTEKIKGQKGELLSITKNQESKYQTLLTETKKTAAQIRSRIFQLLGGGEMSFADAYKFAKMASQATGIDPALILAVLDRESALGKNVGRCNYKTAMHPTRDIPIFLDLVEELNINPDSVMVSCANKDGAYGGAMGPAQFIPSTWKLYKEKVSKITGSSPASPWNNADAFTATALYLQDNMTGCKASYSSAASQQRCVAAKYYAGSRWKSYLWTYGQAVVDRAASFADDIATITS